MKMNKLITAAGFALLAVAFTGCAGGGTYYAKIEESELKKKEQDSSPIDLSGAGNMDYSYTLPGFNEGGHEEEFTFGVDEPLENGTWVALDTQPIRGVVSWKIVEEDSVPEAALKAQESR